MSESQRIESQFHRADTNHDGTIDEREFRQFLGPVIRDERRLSGSLSPNDIQAFQVGLSSLLSLLSLRPSLSSVVPDGQWRGNGELSGWSGRGRGWFHVESD